MKHLKVLLKWNWWGNFACVLPDAFSEVQNLLSRDPKRKCVWCYIRQLFVSYFSWLVIGLFFSVECEMANFFLVNGDFHSSREAWFCKIAFREPRNNVNSPWTVIFTMSLSFVNCKSTFFIFRVTWSRLSLYLLSF